MISGLSDRYRVISTVGSGGMGVVYKALDTSLNRPVAIKAIRPNALDDQGARRLRAEALAAASLDHPYICKVYELIETPTETLLVMEFVEGETLAAKLERGVPPLEATLLVGSEISEGLAAAHARGVVHRDIKPSNVMITPHGHVKILDFGLARSAAGHSAAASTVTQSSSGNGSPAYMSPEQARGKDIQPASDLFSLGVLLYECLSGRRPFEGRTGYEYVGNLLTEKPQPLAPLAPEAPFALVQLVERCLEKDPGWRPESAESISRELRLLLEAGARGEAASKMARWSSSRVRWGTAAALVIVALLAAGLVMSGRLGDRNEALEASRETVPLVTWASAEQDSKVSPDGMWVSFLSDRNGTERLYVQPMDGGEARLVGIDGEVLAHVWSPDGRRLACYVVTNAGVFLQIVPAFFGGTIEKSVPIQGQVDVTARLVRWIGEDVFLAADSSRGREGRLLTRIGLGDGVLENITPRAIDPELQFQWFDVHPSSRMLVFSAVKNEQEDLWISDAAGTRATRITEDAYFDRYPVWTGAILTFQSNRGGQIDLWQIDPESRQTRLVSSSETEERPDSATVDGRFVTFQQMNANARLWRLGQGAREATSITNDALSDFAPSASPDGRTVVFQRHAGSPSLGITLLDSQLFMLRTNNAGVQSMSMSVPAGFQPQMSPGGTEVAYFARQSSGARFATLLVKDLSTGQIRTVSNQCPLPGYMRAPVEWSHRTMAWASDGSLFFIEQGDEGSLIRRFQAADGKLSNITPLLRTRVVDLYPSKDSRDLAYVLNHDGSLSIRRLNVATGTEQVVHQSKGRLSATSLRGWADDGSLIVVQRQIDVPDDRWPVMAVSALTPGLERRIATIDRAHAFTARLSPEGSTLYFTGAEAKANNIYALHLARGTTRRLTSNQLPSTTFSGIEPLADGSLIYAQDDRRQDIWLSRTSTKRSGQ